MSRRRQSMAALHELYPAAPAAKIQAAALLVIGPYIMVIAEPGRIETFPEKAFLVGRLKPAGAAHEGFHRRRHPQRAPAGSAEGKNSPARTAARGRAKMIIAPTLL